LRIVCDTNVIVSGLLFGGPPRTVLRLIATGAVVNITSADLFREFDGVIRRPKFALSAGEITVMINQLAETFEFAVPSRRVDVVVRDPDDNRVLEAALAGAAEVVVTGDSDLLELASFEGIDLINAAQFVQTFTSWPR